MKFGTSGLRGLVSDMTDEICAAYATAFIRHLARAGEPPAAILVGRDLRPSSLRIAAACLEAIREAGIVAVDCGVLPTPALAVDAAARGAGAIMVTGSHIPFDRNGLKFYRPEGEITKADEAGVLAALAAPDAAAVARGALVDGHAQATAAYLARAMAFARPDALTGLRIGVWQHSAAGRDLLVEALRSLGAETVAIGRTDEFVPVDTEAVPAEDAARARAWVAEHRLDALVSTDGDGDRPLIADETGTFLRGDMVGLLTARRLGADGVATPVSSNTALERTGWFPRIARTRIGSPYVIEGMERLAAAGARLPVGYEANGGFLIGGSVRGTGGATITPLPTRDALAPIICILAAAADASAPLSALSADLPRRFTASDRLQDFAASRSQPLLASLATSADARAELAAAVGRAAVSSVDVSDGVRLICDGELIVHLRASGNAPELRCYAEADDAAAAAAAVAAGLSWAAARA